MIDFHLRPTMPARQVSARSRNENMHSRVSSRSSSKRSSWILVDEAAAALASTLHNPRTRRWVVGRFLRRADDNTVERGIVTLLGLLRFIKSPLVDFLRDDFKPAGCVWEGQLRFGDPSLLSSFPIQSFRSPSETRSGTSSSSSPTPIGKEGKESSG